MTKFVIVTLNLPVGSGIGPTMVLTADIGIVTPNIVTLAELLAGALVEIDELATTITVTSEGGCVNSTVIPVPTTTTTINPCLCYSLSTLEFTNFTYTKCDGTPASVNVTFASPINICSLTVPVRSNLIGTAIPNGFCVESGMDYVCVTTTTTIIIE